MTVDRAVSEAINEWMDMTGDLLLDDEDDPLQVPADDEEEEA